MESSEISVWIVDLRTAGRTLDLALSLLSLEEMQRFERLRIAEKRVQFALTRACLRRILGICKDQPPALVDLVGGPHGKPLLRNSPWEFSVSHSGNVAAVAVALGRRVGVDIERIENSDGRTPGLLRDWTMRESYSKAQGLALPIAGCVCGPGWTQCELSWLPAGYLGWLTAEGQGWTMLELQVRCESLLLMDDSHIDDPQTRATFTAKSIIDS